MRVQKTPEGDKRQLILLFDGVAVGDYHAVALIPVAFVWDRALNVVTLLIAVPDPRSGHRGPDQGK